MMTKLKVALLALGVCALAFSNGCIFSPETGPVGPTLPPAESKDLTQKEDPIFNLILAYNNADIAQYEKLLHPQYTFYNQDKDVLTGMDKFRTREWDMSSTRNMFLATRGQCPEPTLNLDVLKLEMGDGSWMMADTVPGLPTPCVDCWTTMRRYTVSLMLTGGINGWNGDDVVQIIVVPVDEGGKRLYKIYRMDDIAR